VLAAVSRLIPRLGSFSEALAAYRAARLQACLSKLHGIESVSATTLRARTSLRLGDPDAALHALANLENNEIADSHDRGELALLRSVAHYRLRNTEASREAIEDAHAYSISAADSALEAEASFYGALTALGDEDLDGARDACQRGLEIASEPRIFPATTKGYIPLDHVVSRTEELLGVIDAAQGRYRASLAHARSALAMHDRCAISDTYIQAYALKNITIFARDFDITDDARMVAARVLNLAWTADVARVEFTTVEALGWCSALRGDTVEALRLFRRADIAASTVPERIIVGVDRALIAREFGHRPLVLEELEHALNAASTFNWEEAAGDSRDALLVLAQAAAATAPVAAREMLDKYLAIRNAMDITFAARIEPRARAEEAYTHGLVLRAEGRIAASAERLQVAFETWENIGYEWRAARAALELAELDAGEVFRLAIRRELFQRPDSIFSMRARLVA